MAVLLGKLNMSEFATGNSVTINGLNASSQSQRAIPGHTEPDGSHPTKPGHSSCYGQSDSARAWCFRATW
jgi:hypothetical protein